MVFAPMSTSDLQKLLGDAAAQADALVAEVSEDRKRLPVVFPGLGRRFGKQVIGGGRRRVGDAEVDLDAFRACDLAAAYVLLGCGADEHELWDLFAHGDIEERAMILRSLNFLPLGAATVRLLVEVLRTNIVLHLEAALCDSNLLCRAVTASLCDQDTANRLLLKMAFLDVPLERALGAGKCANERLSTMLQDLATEREAAGRHVWRDTWRMLGLAPCEGALARLIGGLEHGDDGVREAAADGLLALQQTSNVPHVAAFARERLPREPRAAVVERLQRLAESQ